jgi:glycosyltransferase involved in cell wall biosynthesis
VRVCIVGKCPPIQGGVSAQTHWFAVQLAQRGHSVHLITNAAEVEQGYQEMYLPAERDVEAQRCRLEGDLTIHSTANLPPEAYYHVPFSKPYSTKLFGLGTQLIEEARPDLIFGSYFEPYGVVAALLGRVHSIPTVIKHAGSDIGRLMLNSDLRSAYHWMLQTASAVVTVERSDVQATLLEMGVDPAKMRFSFGSRLPTYFHDSTVLDFQTFRRSADAWFSDLGAGRRIAETIDGVRDINRKDLHAVPTIGVYGKVGSVKGSYDLLESLGLLAKRGTDFNFITVAAGSEPALARYYDAVTSANALAQRSWILPPLPPWRIPEFINLCDVVCFLERDFPISFHYPVVPREVIVRGKCLVISEEIAAKQACRENLVNWKNVVVVDPRDSESMAAALGRLFGSTATMANIGGHAKCMGDFIESGLPTTSSDVNVIEGLL